MANEQIRRIEEFIKAFYDTKINKENFERLAPDKEDLMQAFKEGKLEEILSLLNKDSIKKLQTCLDKFNGYYEPAVKLIKKNLDKDNADYSKPLLLLRNVWNDDHFGITQTFECKRQWKWGEDQISDISWQLIYPIYPGWTATTEMATATHILNKSFEKLGLKRIEKIDNVYSLDLTKISPGIEECGEYMKELPLKVTIQNILRFHELPKEYSISDLSSNLTSAISKKLFEKLGIKYK